MANENLEEVKADKILDTRGLSCPMPILKCKKEMKSMKAGEIVEVWSTDPGSKNDIPAFVKKQGDEFIGVEDKGNYSRYLIRKLG